MAAKLWGHTAEPMPEVIHVKEQYKKIKQNCFTSPPG